MSEATVTTNSTTDVSKYMYQIRKLKDALASAAKDRDSFKAEADQYRKDNTDIKSKYDESTLAQRLKEAEGKLKEVEYRKTWDRIAKAKGIREDALDAAYQLGGYKPAEGEIDETVIGEAIDEQKGRQTFLAATKDATPAKPEGKAAPGSGQGAKSGTGGTGIFQLPADDDPRWSDNMWLWNTRHQRAEAYKEKKAQGIV
jgi:hypothetical protein